MQAGKRIGTVSYLPEKERNWFFIKDKEREYFVSKQSLSNPNDIDLYCWIGNSVSFNIAPFHGSGSIPIAVDVALAKERSPEVIKVMNQKRTMSGIIRHSKKHKGPYFFIAGDDGKDYFGHKRNMAIPKQYDRYCYVGNTAHFNVVDEGEETPVAINIYLEETDDPCLSEKIERKRQEEAFRKQKEEKRLESARRQEVLKERADKRKEYDDEHKRYVIQVYTDGGWKTVTRNGAPVLFKKIDTGKDCIAHLKKQNTNQRYRLRKMMAFEGQNGVHLTEV